MTLWLDSSIVVDSVEAQKINLIEKKGDFYNTILPKNSAGIDKERLVYVLSYEILRRHSTISAETIPSNNALFCFMQYYLVSLNYTKFSANLVSRGYRLRILFSNTY